MATANMNVSRSTGSVTRRLAAVTGLFTTWVLPPLPPGPLEVVVGRGAAGARGAGGVCSAGDAEAEAIWPDVSLSSKAPASYSRGAEVKARFRGTRVDRMPRLVGAPYSGPRSRGADR